MTYRPSLFEKWNPYFVFKWKIPHLKNPSYQKTWLSKLFVVHMKSYFPSWSKKQCIHTKLSRKVQRNSHFHMTMSTPILKHYHSLSFRFVFNPECFKARHCHLIPSKKVECQAFCTPTLSRLDNARVFCRISAEARLPYDNVHIVLLHVNSSCAFVWAQMTCCDLEWSGIINWLPCGGQGSMWTAF